MITSWKHKGLRDFYYSGSKAGIRPTHATRLTMILQLLDAAEVPEALNLPGFFFHALQGQYRGFYSLRVSGNWRVIFKFDGENVILVDYLDYY